MQNHAYQDMMKRGVIGAMKATPVFFSSRMVAVTASVSPSAAKPQQVMASWRRLGLPLEQCAPTPASVDQLSMAHDRRFVRDVLAGRERNGFGNRSEEVAASLPWTTGAMVSAARHARTHGGAAVAPCSGFHHAGWSHADGFCTFNGLMVAAAVLRAEGAKRVGIFDCDHHFGDGTEEIIERLEARSWLHHVTTGAQYSTEDDVAPFFAGLAETLKQFEGCEVVLYQAGADPHVDDPFGGWLTTAQLRARDAQVFEALAAQGTPVAWNLAGGYQRDADGGISKVLEVHDNTMRECARVFCATGENRLVSG